MSKSIIIGITVLLLAGCKPEDKIDHVASLCSNNQVIGDITYKKINN